MIRFESYKGQSFPFLPLTRDCLAWPGRTSILKRNPSAGLGTVDLACVLASPELRGQPTSVGLSLFGQVHNPACFRVTFHPHWPFRARQGTSNNLRLFAKRELVCDKKPLPRNEPCHSVRPSQSRGCFRRWCGSLVGRFDPFRQHSFRLSEIPRYPTGHDVGYLAFMS